MKGDQNCFSLRKIKNNLTFASANEVRKYLLSPDLAVARDAHSDSLSMGQAFAQIRTAIVRSCAPSERPSVRTAHAARDFIEKVAQGNCCIITEERDELTLELNCRSLPLAELLSSEGLIRIGNNTFRVDRDTVTIIDGAKKANPSAVELFRDLGYQQIDGAPSSKKTSETFVLWELTKEVAEVNRRKWAHGYKVKLIASQKFDGLGSYCEIGVKTFLRYFLGGFYPTWVPTLVRVISIGGQFSGPQSPTHYDLPNPFNHEHKNNVLSMWVTHWRDDNPLYKVNKLTYDCSIYPYDGGRIDADVSK